MLGIALAGINSFASVPDIGPITDAVPPHEHTILYALPEVEGRTLAEAVL